MSVRFSLSTLPSHGEPCSSLKAPFHYRAPTNHRFLLTSRRFLDSRKPRTLSKVRTMSPMKTGIRKCLDPSAVPFDTLGYPIWSWNVYNPILESFRSCTPGRIHPRRSAWFRLLFGSSLTGLGFSTPSAPKDVGDPKNGPRSKRPIGAHCRFPSAIGNSTQR